MGNDNRSSEIAVILQQRVALMRTGEKIPGARELAAEFQAGAGTISSALSALSSLTALWLVQAEPGRGTFVSGRTVLAEPDFSWQNQALGRTRVDAERAASVGAYGASDHIQLSWGYLAPEMLPNED